MTYTSQSEAGSLLNNADVLNKIILDQITNHQANDLHQQPGILVNIAHAFTRDRAGRNSAQTSKLIEQMQNLQSVIDVLTGLRR